MKDAFRTSILSRPWRPALLVLFLLALNAAVASKLFQVEYTQHMDSIEAAYIGLSRWILEHPGEWRWFPLWYGGIPFQNAYPPLLHYLVALTAAVTGLSPAHAHHAVTAALYCLGPVTLFWLVHRLSRALWTSFLAGLVYSLVSPSAFLAPSIAAEMGDAFGPRRFGVLVRYGEGPHVASMTLLPLALAALSWAIGKWRPGPVYAAAAALAAVALTNWIGALALAAGALSLLLADPGAGNPANWIKAGVTGLLAYCLAAPWIPPGTITAIRRNAEIVGGEFPFTRAHILYYAVLAAVLAGALALLGRFRAPGALRFALLFSLILGAISLPSYWFGIYLVPQPHRYHLELEIPLAMLIALAAAALSGALTPRRRAVAALAVLALALVQFKTYHRHADGLVRPIDIRQTIEYRTARWLGENLPGARVFARGSTQFWMNAFADNPQLGGGFAQGISNPVIPRVNFGVSYTTGDPERTLAWLRAYGVDAVAAGGPATRDAYRDWRDPGKFAGRFPELWRDGDDVLYGVPRRSVSLAHAVRAGDFVTREPQNLEDWEQVRAFAAALEDASLPVAVFSWRSPHEAVIRGDLAPGHRLSVQVSWDPGWRASAGGRPCPLSRDALGLIVAEPGCDGPCEVVLTYDGGWQARAAHVASGLSLAAGILWAVRLRRRKRGGRP